MGSSPIALLWRLSSVGRTVVKTKLSCQPLFEVNSAIQMQKLYRNAGYEMPSVVFWNVNSASNVPMTVDDTGTVLVSGCSPSILKAVLTCKIISPVDLMNNAIYTERYDAVGKVFNPS